MKDEYIKAIILDMDGVLWRGMEPIGNLVTIFDAIRDLGWQTSFLTNNATRSVDYYTQKLASFGIHASEEQVLTSAQATGEYLARKYPQGGKVYIIGEEGLVNILRKNGFEHDEDSPLAVIIGLDRALTYEKIRQAAVHLRAGALFIGTNPDPTLPTPEGIIPGAGSILAAVRVASGCTPVIIGKPNPEIFARALSRMGRLPEETLVVGDRLDTDIAGGAASGCRTALVLSGDITQRDLDASLLKPDYVAADLETLINRFQR